jgi:ABC-2 type transport system ATP-binding protein
LLSEVEITCDTVVFIKQGEVIATRDLHSSPEGEIHIAIRVGPVAPETVAGLSQWASSVQLAHNRITLSTKSMDALPEILRHLVGAHVDVYEFTPQRLSLEDSFLNIMGEDPSS